MKQLLTFVLALLIQVTVYAQDSTYSKTSYLEAGFKAPNTHYIGEAWLKFLIHDDPDIDYNITKATFKANSTLDWHKHSAPQVLIIVDGLGYYQERGKDAVLMKVGDVIKCVQGTEHWHSSSKEQDVTYLAVYSGETTWTEKLSQEAYDKVSESLAK